MGLWLSEVGGDVYTGISDCHTMDGAWEDGVAKSYSLASLGGGS